MADGSIVKPIMVGSKTDPKRAAGALSAVLMDDGFAEMRCIGPAAVNNAVKAIAIMRGIVAPSGQDIVCVPAFEVITIKDKDTGKDIQKTAMKFIVQPR